MAEVAVSAFSGIRCLGDCMKIAISHAPFEHCLIIGLLSPGEEADILTAFESESRWKRREEHFYTHSSIDLSQIEPSPVYTPLCGRERISFLRVLIDKAFNTACSEEVRVWGHRLRPGEGIGIHNDNCDSEIRLVLQLNRQWFPRFGGLSILLSRLDKHTLDKIYLPRSNTAIAFATTRTSYHAVSEVMEGERFSVVYVFSRVTS